MAKLAPDLEIGHLHMIEKSKDQCVKEDWVLLRSYVERNRFAKFGTPMKRHILPAKAFHQKGRVPSLLVLYLTLYTIHLSENRLRITKEKLIFQFGNYCGVRTTTDRPLDNLYFKPPRGETTKLSNMKQLCINDQPNNLSQLTTIALILFKVVNTPLKASSLIQQKFGCIRGRSDSETVPIMRVSRENVTPPTPKKIKVATKAKPAETVPDAISPPQAPVLPVSTKNEDTTTSLVNRIATGSLTLPKNRGPSTIATIATGKREHESLTHPRNGTPQATVLRSNQAKQSAKVPSATSTTMLSKPLVANTSVRVLVNKLAGFITTCLESSDKDVIVGLPHAQREI